MKADTGIVLDTERTSVSQSNVALTFHAITNRVYVTITGAATVGEYTIQVLPHTPTSACPVASMVTADLPENAATLSYSSR